MKGWQGGRGLMRPAPTPPKVEGDFGTGHGWRSVARTMLHERLNFNLEGNQGEQGLTVNNPSGHLSVTPLAFDQSKEPHIRTCRIGTHTKVPLHLRRSGGRAHETASSLPHHTATACGSGHVVRRDTRFACARPSLPPDPFAVC